MNDYNSWEESRYARFEAERKGRLWLSVFAVITCVAVFVLEIYFGAFDHV